MEASYDNNDPAAAADTAYAIVTFLRGLLARSDLGALNALLAGDLQDKLGVWLLHRYDLGGHPVADLDEALAQHVKAAEVAARGSPAIPRCSASGAAVLVLAESSLAVELPQLTNDLVRQHATAIISWSGQFAALEAAVDAASAWLWDAAAAPQLDLLADSGSCHRALRAARTTPCARRQYGRPRCARRQTLSRRCGGRALRGQRAVGRGRRRRAAQAGPVADESTMLLMTLFYDQLRSGVAASEALKTAARMLRHRTNAELAELLRAKADGQERGQESVRAALRLVTLAEPETQDHAHPTRWAAFINSGG